MTRVGRLAPRLVALTCGFAVAVAIGVVSAVVLYTAGVAADEYGTGDELSGWFPVLLVVCAAAWVTGTVLGALLLGHLLTRHR